MSQAQYKSYKKALLTLNISSFIVRKKKNLSNDKMSFLFSLNERDYMKTRLKEKYKVSHSNTTRMTRYTILYLQHLLNQQDVCKWKTFMLQILIPVNICLGNCGDIPLFHLLFWLNLLIVNQNFSMCCLFSRWIEVKRTMSHPSDPGHLILKFTLAIWYSTSPLTGPSV